MSPGWPPAPHRLRLDWFRGWPGGLLQELTAICNCASAHLHKDLSMQILSAWGTSARLWATDSPPKVKGNMFSTLLPRDSCLNPHPLYRESRISDSCSFCYKEQGSLPVANVLVTQGIGIQAWPRSHRISPSPSPSCVRAGDRACHWAPRTKHLELLF